MQICSAAAAAAATASTPTRKQKAALAACAVAPAVVSWIWFNCKCTLCLYYTETPANMPYSCEKPTKTHPFLAKLKKKIEWKKKCAASYKIGFLGHVNKLENRSLAWHLCLFCTRAACSIVCAFIWPICSEWHLELRRSHHTDFNFFFFQFKNPRKYSYWAAYKSKNSRAPLVNVGLPFFSVFVCGAMQKPHFISPFDVQKQ